MELIRRFHELPVFKANRGNLMQHWTFCELLTMLRSVNDATDLHYVDAHSMAPWSRPEPRTNQTRHIFNRAAGRLDGSGSNYEVAWYSVSLNPALLYPSSAAFIRGLWKKKISYSLCEIDRAKAGMIAEWGSSVVMDENCIGFQINCREWQVELPIRHRAGLHLIQFDPYGFRSQPPQGDPNCGMMYPSDLQSLITQTQGIERIAVMMSFYDSRNGNTADIVEKATTSIMKNGGYQLLWDVRADNATLSLVYVRGIRQPNRFIDTPQRWISWRDELQQE